MKAEIPLKEALKLAEQIKLALSPGCERIEIAGSIRREKPIIGDIELVAIPRYRAAQMSLIPEDDDKPEASLLDAKLHYLSTVQNYGLPQFKRGDKNGEKYKNFLIPYQHEIIGLDLFITTPPQWGLIFAIRTGPSEFSKALVTQRNKGGWLPSDCKVTGGYIINPDGLKVPTPEEDDLFALLGMEIIPPPERAAYCNANWIPF